MKRKIVIAIILLLIVAGISWFVYWGFFKFDVRIEQKVSIDSYESETCWVRTRVVVYRGALTVGHWESFFTADISVKKVQGELEKQMEKAKVVKKRLKNNIERLKKFNCKECQEE